MRGEWTALIRVEFRLRVARIDLLVPPLAIMGLGGTLVPLAVGPDPQRLAAAAVVGLWIPMLFAMLSACSTELRMDSESGLLDRYRMSPQGIEVFLGLRICLLTLTLGGSMGLMALPVGLAFQLSPPEIFAGALSIITGAPGIAAIGLLAAVLTLMRGDGLIALVALPLLLPGLILGAGWLESVSLLESAPSPDGVAKHSASLLGNLHRSTTETMGAAWLLAAWSLAACILATWGGGLILKQETLN